ncbi:MAG: YkgJ family cysteine cluster protein [Deltaproteobacteria bacterium]|nr:YkgJ family cysteine cluster protein [Deltaproteobacteria bacterium]
MNREATPYPCQRCGTCCEKGGPSLHREDRPLVDDGRIPARCLFTLRRGELARDNVRGTLAPLTEEIIKIKGHSGRWTCRFYDQANRRCGIYDHRPLECRVLNCRDTRRIEGVYETTRLTRQDLLSGVRGLWELIEDHEQRCSYEALHALVGEGIHKGRLKLEKKILEILRFDAHVRQLTVEKGGMDNRMLEFLFGRPLAETITMFEVKLVKKDQTYVLAPTSAFP